MAQLGRIAVVFLGVLGPFLLRPERLFHPAPWVLFVAALVIQLTLPPASRQEKGAASDDRGSGLWILAIGNLVVVVPVFDFVLRDAFLPPIESAWVWAGALALGLGTLVRVWAIRVLGSAFTGLVQTSDNQLLVSRGPYRLLRHPSYFAMLLGFLGEAAMLQSVWGLGLTLGAMLPTYLYRIRVEEHALVTHFGDNYERYQKGTWALLPWVF